MAHLSCVGDDGRRRVVFSNSEVGGFRIVHRSDGTPCLESDFMTGQRELKSWEIELISAFHKGCNYSLKTPVKYHG